MKRLKDFFVNGHEYIFDGESVQLFPKETYCKAIKAEKPLNSHRTNYLRTICLVLNNSCNLGCEYCFANKGHYDKPNEQMDFAIAKQAVDNLAKEVKENNGNEMSISFFGGEPLLSFNLIQEIVHYIRENYPCYSVHYMITTNGTLINKEIAEFMETNKFDIMISIDGTQEIHDYYRKFLNGCGSYKRLLKGISYFKNPQILNARITITNINYDICSYIDSILNLGFRRITFAVDYNISEIAFHGYLLSLKKLIKKYFNDIANGKLYDITNFSRVIVNIALNQRNLSHCNAGISYLAVSADGKYYRCPRFVGKENFLLGKVNDITHMHNEIQNFKRKLSLPEIRNPNCQKCVYVYLCGGMCYHHSYVVSRNEFNTTPRECDEKFTIFEGVIEGICKLSTKERRTLLLFYTNLWNLIRKEEQK